MTLRLLAATLAVTAVAGTASAQYPLYNYTFTNPYTGYTTGSSAAYNPYTGGLGFYSSGYNPYTGFGTRNVQYTNAFGGFYNKNAAYNAYTGASIYNARGYNPFWGNSFYRSGARPGYGYGYWR